MAGVEANRIIQVFRHFDASGDGLISFKELCGIMRGLAEEGAPDTSEEDVLAMMKAADKDNDGFISYSEFVSWVMGEVTISFPAQFMDSRPGHRLKGIQVNQVPRAEGINAFILTLPEDMAAVAPDFKQGDEVVEVNGTRGTCEELMTALGEACTDTGDLVLKVCHAGVLDKIAVMKGLPRPQCAADGTPYPSLYWGITKQQLADTLEQCRADPKWSDEDTIADMVNKFVKPTTAGTGMGLSMLLNKDAPREVNLMVSHAWSENAGRFLEDLTRHLLLGGRCSSVGWCRFLPLRGVSVSLHRVRAVGKSTGKNFDGYSLVAQNSKHMHDDEIAFICAFALYQESGPDILAQLGDELAMGPFAAVIQKLSKAGGRMLVVPNEELRSNGQGLYSRMWCVWEVFVAKTMRVKIETTDRSSSEHLFGDNPEWSCKAARCGNPALSMNEDERKIRKAIESMFLEMPDFDASGRCIGTSGRMTATGLGDGYAEVDVVIKALSHEGGRPEEA